MGTVTADNDIVIYKEKKLCWSKDSHNFRDVKYFTTLSYLTLFYEVIATRKKHFTCIYLISVLYVSLVLCTHVLFKTDRQANGLESYPRGNLSPFHTIGGAIKAFCAI